MNPATLGVLVPIIAIGGFFAWMIALAASKAYLAKLKAQPPAVGAAGQEDVLAAVDEVRREVAELAERVDFTERLLAKQREPDKLAPPPPS
jgi:hypothetical protein